MLRRSYNSKSVEEKLQNVQNQCNIMANQIPLNQFDIASSKTNLNVEIDQLANVWEGRILVIDSKYKIIKDTYTIDQDNYLIYDQVIMVMRGEKDKSIRMFNDYAEVIWPIVNTDKEISGVMIVNVSLKDVADTNRYIVKQANVLMVLFSLVAMIVAYVICKISMGDFKKLQMQIEGLTDGHFESLTVRSRYNEMKQLAETFNIL